MNYNLHDVMCDFSLDEEFRSYTTPNTGTVVSITDPRLKLDYLHITDLDVHIPSNRLFQIPGNP